MGIRLIFLSLVEVTDCGSCHGLSDCHGCEAVPGNSPTV